jgi:hypothetical protein
VIENEDSRGGRTVGNENVIVSIAADGGRETYRMSSKETKGSVSV